MKTTIASVVVAALVIGGALWYSNSRSDGRAADDARANNVSIVDGTQIIDIDVKGGYGPRKSVATAGLPTIIRFNTNGTYDCSIAVRIPSISYAKNLPSVGTTELNIGTSTPGIFRGMCAMGMYSFEVEFGV